MKHQTNNILKNVFFIFADLFFAVFLFIFSNPNFLIKQGCSFLAWFIYIPVLFVVKRTNVKITWFFGGIYGALSILIYAYWLKNYDSLCLIALVLFYFILLAILFEILKIVDLLFEKNAWFVQWLVICSYEYLKTLGFLGFSYGVTAYTQWKNVTLLQSVSLIGVFGFNAFIIFSSCVIYSIIQKYLERKNIIYKMETDNNLYECNTHINFVSRYDKELKKVSLKIPMICFVVFIICFIANFLYGKIELKRERDYKTIKIAAIQNNENPFEDGISVYRDNIQKLINLTDDALELNPDISIVVWPETAVVPAVVYQFNTKKNESRYKLISSLLSYINSKENAFVIGNGHIVATDNDLQEKYNSALFFKPHENVIPPEPEIYCKNHLVPFSEYFPYKGLFPHVNNYLQQKETNMWNPGTDYNSFNLGDFYFSTPICFEDTFGDVCRKMYLNGSRCFLNLSNDSWSKSEACQYQHLAMAVFRSIENKVPSVRSTASGQTCIISQNGKIEQMIPAFCETYIVGEIPIIEKDREPTFFTLYGDICGYGTVILASLLLIIRIIIVIIKKVNR